MKIVFPSTCWLDFQGSQALQKACLMDSKWDPQFEKIIKKTKKLGSQQKHVNINWQEVGKSNKWGPRGGVYQASFSSRIMEHNTFWLFGPDGRPGVQKASQRRPKGFEKVAKRHEKDIQRPQGIQMQ